MGYINRLMLISELLQKKIPDSKKLLADVNRQKVIRALEKTKKGVPKPFQHTNEPIEEDNLSKMREQDKMCLWDIYERIPKSPEKELPRLMALQQRYPDVPSIYNYIGVAHAYNRQPRQYLEALIKTTKKFPDYLFGKISLAEYYINHNAHHKVPDVLDRKFEIYEHYPATTVIFHVSEVRAFYGAVGRYFIRANKLARALFCYFILEDVDPDHWSLRQLGDEIIQKEVTKVRRNFPKSQRQAPKEKK